MVKKFANIVLFSIIGLFILSFETTIGLPLVSLLWAIRFLLHLEGNARIVASCFISLLIALSLQVSLTIVFLCLVMATFISIKVKQDTILQHIAIASICVVIIVIFGQIQLFDASFIYFFCIWLVVIGTMFFNHLNIRNKRSIAT